LVNPFPEIIAVGASTCIFGLLGAILSFFILNWNYLAQLRELRCCFMCFLFFFIFLFFTFSFIPSEEGSAIDNFGHLGGLISGIFLGLCIPKPRIKGEYERNCRIVGIVLISSFALLTFSLFYFFKFK
jgi:membrane associated rhomboid family serine protease